MAYKQADVAHATDFATPLQHGIIRYIPGPNVDAPGDLPVKNDCHYVYVPAGYVQRESKKYVSKIMDAMELAMPNLVLVTGATEGTLQEQHAQHWKVDRPEQHPLAKTWTEQHRTQVLDSKVKELLTSTVSSCVEVGAWIMPQVPRRRNGAAQLICQALPKDSTAHPIVMGLIGLDTQDEQEGGLKESLVNSMEPVGSPIRTVCSIEIDPTVKDGAPLPQLTHLVVFESPHELQQWKQELLQAVPDMLLLFGNITDAAVDSMMEAVEDSSPVLLLRHTHTRIGKLARMFKHIRKHMALMKSSSGAATGATAGDTTTLPGSTTTASSLPVDLLSAAPAALASALPSSSTTPTALAATGSKKKRLKIPPMPDMDDEQINLFVSTWPASFNPESVVVADPLLVTGPVFQKRILAAVTACFDLKMGGDDTQRAKKKALDYAWSFHDVAQRHVGNKHRAAESLHLQLVAYTFISIIASVGYDQVYGGLKTQSGSTVQLITFVSTILLPLYVTSLKQESDKNNPTIKWNAFRVAAAKMESEIIQFRTQIGPYRAAAKTERSMRKPLQHFATRTRSIWLSVKQYLVDDGLEIPDSFWEDGSPAEEEVAKQKEKEEEKNATLKAVAKKEGNARSLFSFFGGNKMLKKAENLASQVGVDDAAFPSETTPIFQQGDKEEEDDDDDDDEEDPSAAKRDDFYSAMTADKYIEVRMKVKMQEKIQELQVMVSRNQRISAFIKLITIFSGATAALSLQWVVPIILGASAALTSGQDFRKYPARIEMANAMVVQLNDLKLWWMSLSMYQRQLPHNKDKLIQQSEKAILMELSSTVDGTASHDENHDDK